MSSDNSEKTDEFENEDNSISIDIVFQGAHLDTERLEALQRGEVPANEDTKIQYAVEVPSVLSEKVNELERLIKEIDGAYKGEIAMPHNEFNEKLKRADALKAEIDALMSEEKGKDTVTCSKCGNAMKSGDVFCSKCGAKITGRKETRAAYVQAAEEPALDRQKTIEHLKACGAVEKQKEIGYGIKDMLETMSGDIKTERYIDPKRDKPLYDVYKISGGCIWLSLRIGALLMFGLWLYILIASIVQNGVAATVEDKWFGGSVVVILVSAAIAFSKIIIQRISYGKAKRLFKKQCRADEARVKNAQAKKKKISEIISKIPPELDKLNSLSEKLYENGLIYPKYHNASALLYMAELFETNRVSGFNGARGAYALYEANQLTQHTSDEILNETVAIAQDVGEFLDAKASSMPLLQKYFDTNSKIFSEMM